MTWTDGCAVPMAQPSTSTSAASGPLSSWTPSSRTRAASELMGCCGSCRSCGRPKRRPPTGAWKTLRVSHSSHSTLLTGPSWSQRGQSQLSYRGVRSGAFADPASRRVPGPRSTFRGASLRAFPPAGSGAYSSVRRAKRSVSTACIAWGSRPRDPHSAPSLPPVQVPIRAFGARSGAFPMLASRRVHPARCKFRKLRRGAKRAAWKKTKRDRVDQRVRTRVRIPARPHDRAFRSRPPRLPPNPDDPSRRSQRAAHTNRRRRDPNSLSLLAGIVPGGGRPGVRYSTDTYGHDHLTRGVS